MNLTRLSLVMFHGNVNIDGRNGNNLDASRDGCELFFHDVSGGVVVAWGGKQHYVPAVSVMSATFQDALPSVPQEPSVQKAPQSDMVAQAESDAVANSSLADDVLKEFSEDQDATPKPKPKRK